LIAPADRQAAVTAQLEHDGAVMPNRANTTAEFARDRH
jgi:hypothetical protein